MKEEFENIFSWIKDNKLSFIVVLAVVAFIGGIIFYGLTWDQYGAPAMEPGKVPDGRVPEEGYKVKTGSATVESSDATSDFESARQKTQFLGGWVEEMNKNSNQSRISINATLKIPSENFDTFSDWLMNNFEVVNADFGFYRITFEEKKDEIEILKQEIEVYENLINRSKEMKVSVESIDLIDRLTQEKLEAMEKLREYGYSVEEKKEKTKYGTLKITITQKKEINLVPEGVGREFRSSLRESVEGIISSGISLITKPPALLVKAIMWIIFAIVIIVPLFIISKLVYKFLKWTNEKIS